MGSIAAAQSAIQALYGSDSSQRQAANVWLAEYASSEQAWECMQLLQGDLAPEVQFFSVNLIISKVRHAWRQLQPDARHQIQSFVRNKLEDRISNASNRLVTQRLCLLLAAMAAADGAEAAAVLLNRAIQLTTGASNGNQAATEVALELLLSIAEEAAALDTRRQGSFIQKGMQPQAPGVFSMLGRILETSLATPGQFSTTALALRCTQAWLGLSLRDSHGQSMCSPGALQKHRSQLFTSLNACSSAVDSAVIDAAAEAFEVLLESEEGGFDEEADRRAMSAIAQGLLANKNTLQGGEVESGRARLVAKVAAALADRSPEGVAQALPEAVPLAELMMTCLSLGQRGVAEFAIDYLDSLSTVPLAERQPQLQQPLYSSLLQVLFPHMQFPQSFTNWDEWVEDDEEAFNRFREQSLQEVLEISFGVLGSHYLAVMSHQLQSAATWQSAEAALFGIRCVSSSVLESASPDSQDQSEEGSHQQNNRALLSSLFRQLCSGQGQLTQTGLLQQPWVMATAARLIGDYALWFSNLGGPDVPLEAALKLLLQALTMPQAAPAAAKAFRGLCIRCAPRLTNPADVEGLIGLAHTALQTAATSPGVVVELVDKQSVVEGLARVTALLPPPAAARAGQHLIGPFLQAAQVDLQNDPGSTQRSEQLAARLQLVACAIRFMEFGSSASPAAGSHPVLSMFEASQPLLTGIMQIPSLQASAPVISALCEVFCSTLTSMREAAQPLLPALATPCVTLFQTHQQPPCLDALASCVLYFSAVPAAANLLTHALYVACSASEPVFQAHQLASRQEHVTSLFRLADNYILMAPALAQASGALPSLFQWAVQAVQLREAEPLRCVISFLSHWAAPSSGLLTKADKQAMQEALYSCLSHWGQELVQAMALALVQTCPRHLLRSLAPPLRALLGDPAMSDAVKSFLSQIVCSKQYIDLSGGALDADSCQLFCRLAMQPGALSLHRFSALLQDFGSLARGEGTSDVLLAYEL